MIYLLGCQAARQSQNASLDDYDPFGGGGGGGGVGGISVNGITPTLAATTSPAVMQVHDDAERET